MAQRPTRVRVLLVDDDDDDFVMTRALLADAGDDRFSLDWAATFEEAAAIIRRGEHDVYLVDYRLGRRDGLELMRESLAAGCEAPMILLTGQGDHEVDLKAMKTGAADYLVKGSIDALLLERSIRYAIERKRAEQKLAAARRREVEIASNIQETLLLGAPPAKLAGMQVAVLSIPSERIDGDFLEFFRHDEYCVDVIIGDVMGKGIPAALLGAAAKSEFMRVLSRLLSQGTAGPRPLPRDIVTGVHAAVTRQLIALDSFITLCYARFDMRAGAVDFVDCGHTNMLQLRAATSVCERRKSINMPLGFTEGEVYQQHRVPADKGDIFLFYSDGVTEARSPAGEFFGETRLTDLLTAKRELNPVDLIAVVRNAVVRFTGSEALRDDLTLICVKIEREGEHEALLMHRELETSSDFAALKEARTFLRDLCRDLGPDGPDEERVSLIELGVNEAVSNIMKHAYRGRTGRRIRVEADAYRGRISVRVYHWGTPFEPQPGPVARPDFEGAQDGGFGLYIIALSLDEVRYAHDAQGRNVISLVKSWQQREGGDAHGPDDGKGR